MVMKVAPNMADPISIKNSDIGLQEQIIKQIITTKASILTIHHLKIREDILIYTSCNVSRLSHKNSGTKYCSVNVWLRNHNWQE